MKIYIVHGKLKIMIITFVYLVVLGTSVFAMGSGQYKQFTYREGDVNRSVRTEYIGYYLKEISTKANGTILVVKGNFCPWNGEFTGWEDIGEERIAYADSLDSRYVMESAIEATPLVNVTKMNGSTIILEATPDKDGDYWWWTTNGTIQFFQNLWIVR
jgi:hypothetical protein